MEVKEYLDTLKEETRNAVLLEMAAVHYGYRGDPPVDTGACSGCEATTPNGSCRKINGNCVWVPFI